jgi:hypothetical protein
VCFGPGWRAALSGPADGSGDATLIDNSASGSMTVQDSDGTEYVFVKQASGGYAGVGDANNGSTLVRTASIRNPADPADATVYTGWQLTDTDGTVTTWLKTAPPGWLRGSTRSARRTRRRTHGTARAPW